MPRAWDRIGKAGIISEKGKWTLLTLLVFGCTAAFLAAFGGLLRLSGPFRLQTLYVFLGCLAIAVALFLVDKSLSKKACNDPKLMEKVFGSVLNNAMYADMTPYGFDEILIGSDWGNWSDCLLVSTRRIQTC